MIQWKRAPGPDSGSKWKTIRWIQYSISVQNSQPAATSPTVSAGVQLGRADTNSTPTVGQEDQRRHGRMDARETVEEVRVEHPRRRLEDVCTAGIQHTQNLPHGPFMLESAQPRCQRPPQEATRYSSPNAAVMP